MIPESKNAVVERALQKAFGVTQFETIQGLTAGLSSALVFRIVVKGRPYLLRIITRTDPMADPTRPFASMKLAAEAGLAPRIWYASIEDRVLITDFVEVQPFPLPEARVRMPATLRCLHNLPPFPERLHYLDRLESFVHKFKAARLLPESETEELFQHYARIAAVYPRQEAEVVSCHNDVKPENVLFDGQRVWLVDWESAFLNDRYVDLSIVANFLVDTDAEEDVFLNTYFGEPAGEYRRARFYLMRQALHVFYTIAFRLFRSGGGLVRPDPALPAFRDFHTRIWSGEITLAGDDARVQYSLVHLKQALANMRAPRFEESVRILAGRQATV